MTEVQDTFLSEYFEDTQQAKHYAHPDENEIAVKKDIKADCFGESKLNTLIV